MLTFANIGYLVPSENANLSICQDGFGFDKPNFFDLSQENKIFRYVMEFLPTC